MPGKSTFIKLVDEGRKGHNIGLSIGSKKLELYMDGLLPGTGYLIGGASGTGKSTYVLWAFIYTPLMSFLSGESKERDPYWILFNLEMTTPQIYAKLMSMYLFDKYGEQIRFKEIFSRGKECMLSDEHYDLIIKNQDFLDILDQRLITHDGSLNEKKYLSCLNKDILKFGKWNESHSEFIPNNPHQVVGVVIDHMSLISESNGRRKKEEMDAISRASVSIKNITHIVSPIHVAQFNRNSTSDERLKQSMTEPTSSDFKDTGSLYEDSQVVIGLYSPHKARRNNYREYRIKDALEDVFIGTFLLKSRFGNSDILVPMGYYGDCSHFLELPKASEIRDYTTYKTPYWSLYKTDFEVEDKNEKKDEVVHKQKFDYTL